MPLSPGEQGDRYDTTYVKFEWILRSAFVVDQKWGDRSEPARIVFSIVDQNCVEYSVSSKVRPA